MTNNMASSGLLENMILSNIILTTYDITGCVKSETWCEMVWHLIVDAGPHTYPVLWGVDVSLCGESVGQAVGNCSGEEIT